MSVLSRTKYFGLRFLYFRLISVFPYLAEMFFDTFFPKLVSRSISKKFINYFNGEQGQGVDVKRRDYPGLGMIHYSLIRTIRPKRVLVVGSLRGYVPAMCALACEDNDYGQVDFLDAGFGEETTKSWGQDGFWKKVNVYQYFRQKGLKRIKPFIMTNVDFARKHKSTYQYIYIDGDHTYKGVKLDYSLFWPRLEKGGLMLFHDILGTGEFAGAEFGVKKFWNQIKNKNKVSINFPLESGLGMLQKK